MPLPTSNMHKKSVVNHVLYIVYYTAHAHIILSVLTEYTEAKDSLLNYDLLCNLCSCSMLTFGR
jgi:hypothetical protein